MRISSVEENQDSAKINRPLKLTKSLMNQYRNSLSSRGCKQQTISMYFCYLNRLYEYLPEEKEITYDALRQWILSLKKDGFSDRTINMHISSINGLLRFCGQKCIPVSVISEPSDADYPELSREEYLILLIYAKENCSERDYLLIKTLANIDIGVVDLRFLTVQAVRKGVVELPNNKEAMIPESLQKELVAYIDRRGVKRGPVFVSKSGQVLDRSNITHMIRKLGENAGIESGKCNPRALHRLYMRTQKEIDHELMSLHMQVYNSLLDNEQKKENILKVG